MNGGLLMKRILLFITIFCTLLAQANIVFAQYNGGVSDGYASYLIPNSLPVGKDTALQLVESEVFTFSDSYFSFTDPDGVFDGIVIQQINIKGDLEYNGVNVAVGTWCRDLTQLVFEVTPGESGFPYATFTFKLRDNDGGLSALNYTVTFNVVQNPKVFDKTITINEDANYSFTSANLNYELGLNRSFFRYVVYSLPDSGTLYIRGVPAAANDTFSTPGSLTFAPTKDKNGANHTLFSYKVIDNTGRYSNVPGFINISINPVNDAPTSGNVTISTFEDQQYNFAGNEFSFADVDGHVFAGIQITSLPANSELISGVKVVEANELVVQINSLVFKPLPQMFGTPLTIFRFRIKDTSGQLSETEYTVTCNVKGIKDPPTGSAFNISMEEDKIYNFKSSDFAFQDIDNDAFAGVVISSVPSSGKLTYNGSQIGSLSSVPDVTRLSYVPANNANGDSVDAFYFKVKDSSGETSIEVYSCYITITPVSDPPIAKSFKLTITEDSPYGFTKSNFQFTDPDIGDTIQSLMVFYLPAKGILTYDGDPIFAGAMVKDFDKLVYTPNQNEFGNNYANWGFKLIDGGNTRSIEADTVTFTVTSVFDNPVPLDTTILATEDLKFAFSKNNFRIYDADNHFLTTIFIAEPPVLGELRYNGLTVLPNEEIINYSMLEYLPPADLNGAKVDSFEIKVKDSSGAISDSSCTIFVSLGPVNDAPTTIVLLSDTIAEGLPSESLVSILRGVDIDSKSFTFELVSSPDLQDADNAKFMIADTILYSNEVFDYESQSLFSIYLKVFDEENLTAEKGFFVQVLNRNETAIYEISPDEVNIFPNPAQSELFMVLPEHMVGEYSVSISDLNGRVLSGFTSVNTSYQRLDLTALPDGMYVLSIRSSSMLFVRQFVVKK